jgi:hypothetical protein
METHSHISTRLESHGRVDAVVLVDLQQFVVPLDGNDFVSEQEGFVRGENQTFQYHHRLP